MRNREKLDGRGSNEGMVMSGGREYGGYMACREHSWRDEGVMEGWWEYREKEERGEQQWEGGGGTRCHILFLFSSMGQ